MTGNIYFEQFRPILIQNGLKDYNNDTGLILEYRPDDKMKKSNYRTRAIINRFLVISAQIYAWQINFAIISSKNMHILQHRIIEN